MDKPVSMLIEETQKSLTDIINKCRLHPSIVEMIVKDIYLELCQFNAVNTMKEKEQYMQKSIKEQ